MTARTVLAVYGLLFAIAFGLALLFTPMVRALALRFGIVAHGGGRRIHNGPMPRLGGVALLAAAGGAALVAQAIGIDLGSVLARYRWNIAPLVGGALLILALGVVDDIWELRPIPKLVVQTIAALIAMRGGYGVEALTNPFTGGYIWLSSLSGVVTLLWIVGVTNGFNLIDGLDGLAVGTGLIATITLFLVALAESRPDAALLAATLAGALTGFLRFNFNPASIFLGDSGSLLLGYVLSVLSIQSLQKGPTTVLLLVPILTLGLPIIEAGVTLVRRGLVVGIASIFQADREHIHHRLLELGMTQRNAVLVLYGVGVALGGLAFLSITVRGIGNGVIVGAVALATWLAIRKLGYRR